MNVIARFTVPATEFALGDVLEVDPSMSVRLESMVPTGGSLVPFFWIDTDNVARVEEALEESDLVLDWDVVDRTEAESLFRVTWREDINGLIEAIENHEAVVLEGVGMGDDWSFRLRFPDHDKLSAFYQTCRETGLPMHVDAVHDPVEAGPDPAYGLTEDQREALLLALQEGYFSVPREITLVELAEELGVSDSAASQRIRRGLRTLIAGTVADDLLGVHDD